MTVDGTATLATLTAAMTAAESAIAAVGTLDGAPIGTLAPAVTAVQAAESAFDDAITAFDADIVLTSTAGVVAGLPYADLVTTLEQQSIEAQQLSLLISARASIRRVLTNLQQAPG